MAAAVGLGVLALGGLGCDAGVQGGAGTGALLRVSGATFAGGSVVSSATFVEGALPAAPDPAVADGPTVKITQIHSLIFPGAGQRALTGSVQAGARSIAIGLADDIGYWIIPAATADHETLGSTDLLFNAILSYSMSLSPGSHDLVLRGLLGDRRMGPATTQALSVTGDDVTGAMVVTLSWDTEADLDLHVVAPNPPDSSKPLGTTEVWVKNPSSLPPRSIAEGGAYSPEELAAGGQLDFDSNGACLIDGRRREHVVWGMAPPMGHYIIRVDAVSMCGEAGAKWQLDVVAASGALLKSAYGQMGDADTRFSHTKGSGVLALELDVP